MSALADTSDMGSQADNLKNFFSGKISGVHVLGRVFRKQFQQPRPVPAVVRQCLNRGPPFSFTNAPYLQAHGMPRILAWSVHLLYCLAVARRRHGYMKGVSGHRHQRLQTPQLRNGLQTRYTTCVCELNYSFFLCTEKKRAAKRRCMIQRCICSSCV